MLRALLGLLLGCVFALHSLQWLPLPPLSAIDRAAYDYLVRSSPPNPTPVDQVVILDIDEKSLANPKLGRWPWSRDVMTQVVTSLFEDYEVRVLGFDVVFSEPDTSSGLTTLDALAAGPLAGNADYMRLLEALRPGLAYDTVFSELLMQYPVVLGYYFNLAQVDQVKSGALPLPALFGDEVSLEEGHIGQATGFGANISVLADASLAAGHFNPIVDPDGLIRKVPLLLAYEGDLFESLSLATFRTFKALEQAEAGGESLTLPPLLLLDESGVPAEDVNGAVLGAIEVGGKHIPVGSDASIFVAYQGPKKTFAYLSFDDLVEGRISVEQLKNKLVLVGTTAPGLSDFRATPLGELYPGVEVHANVLASLLSDQPTAVPARPIETRLLEPLAILVCTVLLVLVLRRLSPLASTAVWLALSGIAVGGVFYSWTAYQFVIHGAPLLGAVTSIFLWNFGYQFYADHKKKAQFANLFGQYVPPELVKKMAEDPTRYSMKGQRLPLTVMFSDVRGFTTISEQLSPTELSEFINIYLSTMSQIIRDHDGTLDKYIGDCIMAFWGAPVDNERHALSAVKTALAMGEALGEINTICKERGWPPIEIGIGLNTGSMSVGDMGSAVRKAYTVMGDAVNLGSRLEGLTRNYGVLTIVSETTASACPEVVFRELDRVTVKGKTEPVAIFEPIGYSADILPEARAEIARWEKIRSDYRGQKFAEVVQAIDELREANMAPAVYDWLYDQAHQYQTHPPGISWDGVTVFKTK